MENYYKETCCNCGLEFLITRGFYSLLQKTGRTFYCPSGHAQFYTENEASKFKKQLLEKDSIISGLRSQIESCESQIKRKKNKK